MSNRDIPRRLPVVPQAPSFEQVVVDALAELKNGQEILLRGQADLTVAFGQLHRRLSVVETEEKWRKWALTAGKAAVPFVVGLIAARWPAIGAIVNDILQAAPPP